LWGTKGFACNKSHPAGRLRQLTLIDLHCTFGCYHFTSGDVQRASGYWNRTSCHVQSASGERQL